MTTLEKRQKNSEATRKWRKAHPERHNARQRRWLASHPGKAYEVTKKYRQKNPDKFVESYRRDLLKRIYGITLGEYNSMFQAQGGVCALCKLPPKTRRLHIDHDHRVGRIRGLLCFRCNTAIGKIERKFSTLRTPEFLVKIREYLLRPIPLGLEGEK